MVDYVTTLAVSVTAGVEAIIAFIPSLDSERVVLDLAAIALLVLINLRGVREAGAFFVLPTYIFVLSLGALVVVGLWQVQTGHTHLYSVALSHAAEPVSLFLLARAFAGGCTAMTGVEAIANGVPVFKKPEPVNASRTLLLLAVILAALFLGVAFLGNMLGARPSDQASVIAQVGRAVVPGSPLSYIVQVSSSIILLLAANTSFNGFPLLASIMARADFLPHQFAHRGQRLALSNGIVIIGRRSRGDGADLPGQHTRTDPAFRDRRISQFHAVAGGDGPALAQGTGHSLAGQTGHQRLWCGHHRAGQRRGCGDQVHPGCVGDPDRGASVGRQFPLAAHATPMRRRR